MPEHEATTAELETVKHQLTERGKELNCIYRLSDLVDHAENSPEMVYQGVADLIDPSWQYPGETCGRVTIRGQEFTSDGFKETEWRQAQDIRIDGISIGQVEVFYLAEKPDMGDGEGPFMKDERHLLNVIAERIGEYARRRQSEYDMNERLKELDCMYGISDLMVDTTLSEHELCQGIADIIPVSWQYPDVTCARVTVRGTEYVTHGFVETEWNQHEDVSVEGDIVGAIDVFYVEEKPDMGDEEGPFLKEERHLIRCIAERVGEYVRRLLVREQAETMAEQSRAILEMSTPVIKMWDEIILMPLIGVVDTSRTSQMIQSLLQAIVDSGAKVAVLDVTGVPVIDTGVARHLLQTVDSARILGAEVIITGFSPDAAQTLAQLGVDFSALRTRGALQAGIAEAFNIIGRAVHKEI